MSVRINERTVKMILGSNIKDFINKDILIDILMQTLDSNVLEQVIELNMMNTKYRPFKVGDLVEFKQSDAPSIKLIDFGLACNEYRRGVIIGSDDYRDEFNPYYYKMKINMLGLNNENKVSVMEISTYTNEIRLISEDIETLMNQYQHALRSV
jgi:hypothetical protein